MQGGWLGRRLEIRRVRARGWVRAGSRRASFREPKAPTAFCADAQARHTPSQRRGCASEQARPLSLSLRRAGCGQGASGPTREGTCSIVPGVDITARSRSTYACPESLHDFARTRRAGAAHRSRTPDVPLPILLILLRPQRRRSTPRPAAAACIGRRPPLGAGPVTDRASARRIAGPRAQRLRRLRASVCVCAYCVCARARAVRRHERVSVRAPPLAWLLRHFSHASCAPAMALRRDPHPGPAPPLCNIGCRGGYGWLPPTT